MGLKFFRKPKIKAPPAQYSTKQKAPKYGVSRTKKRTSPRLFIALAMLIIVLVAFISSYYRFDRRILPMVLEAAELRLQAEINNVINDVIQDIIYQRNFTAADFLIKTDGGAGSPVLTVNTVLANDICNTAANKISQRLNNLQAEEVSVPMGMALGLDTLAQVGPRFTFNLAPIGNALVNYKTSFTAVGINQTHFSVWLHVESVVRIINPVHSTEIVVTRNISLVDTVISGVVPDTFLNLDTNP